MMKEKVSGGILNVKKLGETLVLRGKKALKEKEGMNYALWLLAGFLSSGASFGTMHPFGIALCSAFTFTNLNIVIAFGAALGYTFFLSGDGLCYMGAVLVMVSLGVMTAKESRHRSILPFASAIAVGFTSGLIRLSESLANWGIASAEMVLTALLTYCFMGLESEDNTRKTVARTAFYITFIMFFSRMHLFTYISLARCLIIFAIFIYMYAGGAQGSVMTAISFGMVLDISRGDIFYSGIYGISAVVMSLMKVSGKYQIALIYTIISAVAAFVCGDMLTGLSALLESMTTTLIFVTLPQSVLERTASLFCAASASPKPQKMTKSDNIKDRLSAFSNAIDHVYETIERVGTMGNGKTDENISAVFDKAADTACRKCPIAGNCWDKDYMTTYGVMNDITATLRKKGFITNTDMPYHFAARCLNINKLIGAINQEYSLYIRRKTRENEENGRRKLVARQYAGMQRAIVSLSESAAGTEYYPDYEKRVNSVLVCYDKKARATVYASNGRMCVEIAGLDKTTEADLHQISDSIALCLGREFYKAEKINMSKNTLWRMREKEKFSVSVNVGIREKKGEEICGDCYMYFVTDDGRAVIMLSDGMGSGEEAHLAANSALSLIARFVKAGCSMEESVQAILPVLSMNVDKTGFATLDLLEINMFSGESKLLKYGASPTYIKRHGKVQKFTSSAFPPGLDESTESVNKPSCFRLNEGNIVVMGTDGVLEEGDINQLESLIKAEDDPNTLATGLIDKASHTKDRINDDMTVLIATMKKIR